MSKVVNLTPEVLRRIIKEEKAKVKKTKAKLSGKAVTTKDVANQTKEVEASEMAKTLAAEVDHYKKLQAEAAILMKRLSAINEARQELRAQILEQL
jgi:hypothetical protein